MRSVSLSGTAIAVVAGDRLWWQSRGPTPGRALEALKAAKGELIDLLVRYRLDSAGGLAGDDLLAGLQVAGFAVRRYGVNAALDALGGALDLVPTSLHYAFADKQAEYGLALRALRAPDCLEGNAHAALRKESAAIGAMPDETAEQPSAAMRSRALLGRLRDLGFRADRDDKGALLIADATGYRRDFSRFMDIADVFSKLADEPDCSMRANTTPDDDKAPPKTLGFVKASRLRSRNGSAVDGRKYCCSSKIVGSEKMRRLIAEGGP
jgi:hypothetical protein